jgi:hypothetical protein
VPGWQPQKRPQLSVRLLFLCVRFRDGIWGLMLGENMDAASAGYRVGYEDAAYFRRDYKKLFGAPPQRDIARLRGSRELGGAPARV